MKFFNAKGNDTEYIHIELSSSVSSSNINAANSKSDTNSQTALLLKSQIEDMIKNHRPKTEKEIKAEGENKIRIWSMFFIFFLVLAMFAMISYFGVENGKLPDFANNIMALMTTLIGGIGGFIYGTKK